METPWNLVIVFVTPLLPVAVLALVFKILGAGAATKGRAIPLALTFAYLALSVIAALAILWEPCPANFSTQLVENYGLEERDLKQLAQFHRVLDPQQLAKLAKFDNYVKNAGTALEDYARRIELERLVHGNWCYYSEYRSLDGKVRAFRGDLAIERDPEGGSLALMGSYGTVTFRARRLLMDSQGLAYDWVASETNIGGEQGTSRNGQAFLTFEEAAPVTGLKLEMSGFYWIRLESGLMGGGDMRFVRRDQVHTPGSRQPIHRDCREILAHAGIGGGDSK